jgi:hypothetical protein
MIKEWFRAFLSDPLDLIPGEGEMRRQRWAALGEDAGGCPDWPEIYQKELERARELTSAVELQMALRTALKTDGNLWAAADAETHREWAQEAEAVAAKEAEAEMRAVLVEILKARQGFYSRLRQETFYRGKVLLLSLASLLLAMGTLLVMVGTLRSEGLSRLEGVCVALAAGWVGGSFTWLLGNRRTVGEASLPVLREVSRWTYPISRGLIGAVSAFVLFVALSSGMLPGTSERLLDGEATREEMERAADSFRYITKAAGVEESAVAPVMEKFREQVKTAYQPGAAAHWTQADQRWMEKVGLAAAGGETYVIRETLRRTGDAFWMLVLLCILAGFSETLVPAMVDTSLKKLTGLGG